MARSQKTPATVKREQRLQRLENCAYAAYQMETGKYPYPPGTPRGHKKPDGTPDWNKTELLRIFGWEHGQDTAAVVEDPHFLRMLEYHRWRGSDPTFRKKVQNTIWREIGEELSMQIYEKVKFHPESLTYDQRLKTIKLIIDAGIRLALPKVKDKTDELLGTLDNREREALITEHRQDLQRQLVELNSKALAVEGEASLDSDV